ncbi:MAG: hypothetical protein ACFB21_12305 [Opitutales bacterium]
MNTESNITTNEGQTTSRYDKLTNYITATSGRKLPDADIDKIVQIAKPLIFDDLGVDERKYEKLRDYIAKEVRTALERTSTKRRIDQIRLGSSDTAFSKAAPTDAHLEAARKITLVVWAGYNLPAMEGGMKVEGFRIMRYFAGMLATKFSVKWLGRQLISADWDTQNEANAI